MTQEQVFKSESVKSERVILSLFWFVLVILITADQLTKYVAFRFTAPGLSAKFFDIALFQNYNFAFSLPIPSFAMYGIYFFVIALVAVHLFMAWHKFFTVLKIAWVMVLAGALSNVVERLFNGYVKDFIKIHTGFFNLADVYIIAGAVLILIFSSPRFSRSPEIKK